MNYYLLSDSKSISAIIDSSSTRRYIETVIPQAALDAHLAHGDHEA